MLFRSLIQWANLAALHPFTGTIGLRRQGPGVDGGAEQEEGKHGRKVPHDSSFYNAMPELDMNVPARLRSATKRQYTRVLRANPMAASPRAKADPDLKELEDGPSVTPLLAGPDSRTEVRGL